jgi:hypothetical protein
MMAAIARTGLAHMGAAAPCGPDGTRTRTGSSRPPLIEERAAISVAVEERTVMFPRSAYRDPRLLRELVDRRMVTDIREYLDRYSKSRIEPQSFMATPEGFVSLVHLPAGEIVESLRSISWGNSARGYNRAEIEKNAKPDSGLREDITSSKVRLAEVPRMEKILEDDSIQPLDHLSAETVRTFELVYSAGHTELLLSAETVDDMGKHASLLDSVYGDLGLENADKVTAFLRQ